MGDTGTIPVGDVTKKVRSSISTILTIFVIFTLLSCDLILDAAVRAAGGNLPRVAAPTFSPAAGTYTSEPQTVSISTATDGAFIRYTTDGSTPTRTQGTLYSAPVSIETDGILKAVACRSGWADSSVAEARYRFWLTFGNNTIFGWLRGIALDAEGRIYIGDQTRIVRIDDMNGTGWTTFSGSGGITFSSISGIAVDSDGRIYVSDQGNDRIVRIDDMSGAGLIAFGTTGPGTNQFHVPTGIALDASGRIYISDFTYSRIVRIDDMTGSGWTYDHTYPYNPVSIVVDSSGNIYTGNQGAIEKRNAIPTTERRDFGSYGSEINQFREVQGIAIDESEHIYIADGRYKGIGSYSLRIVRVDDMNGTGWTCFGTLGSGTNQFHGEGWGMTLDTSGHIYVIDTGNCRIVRTTMP